MRAVIHKNPYPDGHIRTAAWWLDEGRIMTARMIPVFVLFTLLLGIPAFHRVAREEMPGEAISASKESDAPADAGRLFPESRIELGSITDNGTRTVSIPFCNSSGLTVQNIRASASCGCTVVDGVPDAIPAGAHGHLTVRIRTAGKAGPLTSAVRLTYSRGEDSVEEAVTIQAVVRPRLKLTADPQIIALGRLRPGATFSARVNLADSSWALLKTRVQEVDVPDWIRVTSTVHRSTDGTSLQLEGTAPTIAGSFSGAIRVRICAERSESTSTLEIPVIGSVEGDVRLEPASIASVCAEKDSHSEVIVKVIARDAVGIRWIDSSVSESQGGTVQVDSGSAGELVIRPSFQDDVTTILRGRILIEVSVGDRVEKAWLPFMFVRRV